MSRVKQAAARWCAFAGAALVMTGCGNFQLARLAPPGILKYEEIASKKPPNPAIEAQLAARNQETEAKFPVLAETPAAGAAPGRAPRAEVEARSTGLQEARDQVDLELARHREADAAERAERDLLAEGREALAEQIDKDETVAQRERAQPMPSLKQTSSDPEE